MLLSRVCDSVVNYFLYSWKNQEKLMKELQQLQQEDLARRRPMVCQMPPQLVELPYKRSEMKEDWQRELEFAFEDMYNADRSKIFSVNFQKFTVKCYSISLKCYLLKCFCGKIHLS